MWLLLTFVLRRSVWYLEIECLGLCNKFEIFLSSDHALSSIINRIRLYRVP